MKKIVLSQRRYALVDNSDFDYLNQWKWYAIKCNKSFYAVRNSKWKNGKHYPIKMHRLIMNTPKGKQVDHKDGNGLNNQRSNLRNCTARQNSMNRRKHSNSSSKFKGVTKVAGKWKARISFKNKLIHIGNFYTQEEAAKEYDKKAKELHKEFALLNFND